MNKSATYIGKDLEVMATAHNYYEWLLSEITPYLGSSIAEVGAGSGGFSRYLLKSKIHSLHAFEPSHNMYEILVKNIKQDCRGQTFLGFFEDSKNGNTYDTILYINVLEHIADDMHELEVAREALAPNGFLIVFVPALQWLFSEFDRKIGHYRRYDKKHLKSLVENAGFSIKKLHYFDCLGVLPWFINFVLLKNPISSGNVALYDKYLIPLVRAIETKVPPLIGKNILMIAQKTPE